MKPVIAQRSCAQPPDSGAFRKVQPLSEGRALPDDELRTAFAVFHRRGPSGLYERFVDAREKLRRDYGAAIDAVENEGGGLRLAARLEFVTLDRTIDEDLFHTVAGMGFILTLRSVPILEGTDGERYECLRRRQPDGSTVEYYEPRMVRTYIVSESRHASSDFSKATDSAEALLRLASMLRPAGISEDLPGKVLQFSAARVSKPPQPDATLQEERTETCSKAS